MLTSVYSQLNKTGIMSDMKGKAMTGEYVAVMWVIWLHLGVLMKAHEKKKVINQNALWVR